MKISETSFAGLLILEPQLHTDHRGFFFESLNKRTYQKLGLVTEFVQENQSRSIKNVIRGLHFQKNPHAQTKLVSVLSGKILDVVVDLRHDQPTFKQWYSIELSAENLKRIVVPRGFAHGFSVLSESADVLYHCDEYYHPESEAGILYNDPFLKIDWGVDNSACILSPKDLALPTIGSDLYLF